MLSIQKIRKITDYDLDNISQSIQKNGLYQLYYTIKNKQELTRQERLLLGYLNSNYLKNNDMLDKVTIPIIQNELRKLIAESPERIMQGVKVVEEQSKEKAKENAEIQQRKLLEKRVVKTIRVKGTYHYSDGEGFSTIMYLTVEVGIDKNNNLLIFDLIDLQPQRNFYDGCDYTVEYNRINKYFSSQVSKSLNEALKGITIVSKNIIKKGV